MDSPIVPVLIVLSIIVVILLVWGFIWLISPHEDQTCELDQTTVKEIRERRYHGSDLEQQAFRRLYDGLRIGDFLHTNLVIPTGKDRTTEVDAVLISRKGIFVLEIKNMRGIVYGREADERWRQVSFNNNIEFRNPIMQNEKHCKAVIKHLEGDPDVFNVVIFDRLDGQDIDVWNEKCMSIDVFINTYRDMENKYSKEEVENWAIGLAEYRATVGDMADHINSITR